MTAAKAVLDILAESGKKGEIAKQIANLSEWNYFSGDTEVSLWSKLGTEWVEILIFPCPPTLLGLRYYGSLSLDWPEFIF